MKMPWNVVPYAALEIARARSTGYQYEYLEVIYREALMEHIQVVRRTVRSVPKNKEPKILRRILQSWMAGRHALSGLRCACFFCIPLGGS